MAHGKELRVSVGDQLVFCGCSVMTRTAGSSASRARERWGTSSGTGGRRTRGHGGRHEIFHNDTVEPNCCSRPSEFGKLVGSFGGWFLGR